MNSLTSMEVVTMTVLMVTVVRSTVCRGLVDVSAVLRVKWVSVLGSGVWLSRVRLMRRSVTVISLLALLFSSRAVRG